MTIERFLCLSERDATSSAYRNCLNTNFLIGLNISKESQQKIFNGKATGSVYLTWPVEEPLSFTEGEARQLLDEFNKVCFKTKDIYVTTDPTLEEGFANGVINALKYLLGVPYVVTPATPFDIDIFKTIVELYGKNSEQWAQIKKIRQQSFTYEGSTQGNRFLKRKGLL